MVCVDLLKEQLSRVVLASASAPQHAARRLTQHHHPVRRRIHPAQPKRLATVGMEPLELRVLLMARRGRIDLVSQERVREQLAGSGPAQVVAVEAAAEEVAEDLGKSMFRDEVRDEGAARKSVEMGCVLLTSDAPWGRLGMVLGFDLTNS